MKNNHEEHHWKFFSTNLNETYQYMLLSENKLKNYAANNAEH